SRSSPRAVWRRCAGFSPKKAAQPARDSLQSHRGPLSGEARARCARQPAEDSGEAAMSVQSDDELYRRYSMVIQWSDEDAAYIVTVPELPGCHTHGKSYEEAVQQGQDAIASWI